MPPNQEETRVFDIFSEQGPPGKIYPSSILSLCWSHSACFDNSAYKGLTHKQLKMHGCIISTVATDALVLKHQAISIHSAD